MTGRRQGWICLMPNWICSKLGINICTFRFGRHVFVGCVVTNAAASSDVLGNIVEELNV